MVRNPFRRDPSPVVSRRQAVQLHRATDGRDILFNDPDGWEVDRPELWWTGPPNGDGTGGPWGNPPPGANEPFMWGSGTLPAVTRATQIICDTIAGLPWHVLKGWDQLDTPQWITDPQMTRLDGRVLGGPGGKAPTDVRLSAVEFWTDWIRSALWLGDGYIFVGQRDATGGPKGILYQLHPSKVQIVTVGYDATTGEPVRRYYVRAADDTDDWLLMDEGSIIHLRGEPPYTNGHGCGVMTRHAKDLGLALTVRSYAQGQYQSGVPAGFIKSTQPNLDEIGANKLKESWFKAHGTSRRSIAVLNATTDFTPIQVTPLDAQLDNARQWSLRDIAMAFGLPGYMLGVSGDSETYANSESRIIELRMFSLLPWMRRIESCLDSEFASGTELKIKSAGLERADTATRFAAYASALTAKWMTVDEVRALEDMAPMPESEAPAVEPPAPALTVPLAAVPTPPATDTPPTDPQAVATG